MKILEIFILRVYNVDPSYTDIDEARLNYFFKSPDPKLRLLILSQKVLFQYTLQSAHDGDGFGALNHPSYITLSGKTGASISTMSWQCVAANQINVQVQMQSKTFTYRVLWMPTEMFLKVAFAVTSF